MIDPNMRTNEAGEQFVLEPGDEGYVDPNLGPNEMAPEPHVEGEALSVDLPVQQAGEGEVPPQDLSLQSAEGQDNSEAIVMNRGLVVESTSPTDIVPNTPQIRPFPSGVVEEEPVADPEALATVEVTDEANTLQDEGEPDHESAKELIAEAEAASTPEELDRIEGQAEGRVTVLNAVEKRRAEL